jgi:hypothetical protein
MTCAGWYTICVLYGEHTYLVEDDIKRNRSVTKCRLGLLLNALFYEHVDDVSPSPVQSNEAVNLGASAMG